MTVLNKIPELNRLGRLVDTETESKTSHCFTLFRRDAQETVGGHMFCCLERSDGIRYAEAKSHTRNMHLYLAQTTHYRSSWLILLSPNKQTTDLGKKQAAIRHPGLLFTTPKHLTSNRVVHSGIGCKGSMIWMTKSLASLTSLGCKAVNPSSTRKARLGFSHPAAHHLGSSDCLTFNSSCPCRPWST